MDPRKLKTTSEVEHQLSLLTARENTLSVALDETIRDRETLDGGIKRLGALVQKAHYLKDQVDGVEGSQDQVYPSQSISVYNDHGDDMDDGGDYDDFEEQQVRDRGLVERVRRVWTTSERVGGKVRKLDVQVGRVKEASERVQQILEFKGAMESLRAAIPKQDYDLATRSCATALLTPESILNGPFASFVLPTSQYPTPPLESLHELRRELLEIFKQEFNKAALEDKDEQKTSRFFKLFPVIGADTEGLQVYGDFVVTLVKGKNPTGGKPSSPLYYTHHLTALLESIALIIDTHQSVVDKYYGQGKMRVVVQRLQQEADSVVRGLVEGWEDERRVGRLIVDVQTAQRAYKDPLSFQPSTHQAASPAAAAAPSSSHPSSHTATSTFTALSSHAQHGLAQLPGAASSLLAQYAGGSSADSPQPRSSAQFDSVDPEEEKPSGPDPRDIDRVVGEMVTLSGRWGLYRRFVTDRLILDDEDDEQVVEKSKAPSEGKDSSEDHAPAPVELTVPEIDQSDSQKAISNMLSKYYEPLETWYLLSSVTKAQAMDTPDLAATPYISSVVDDVFYLVKLVLNRVITSASLSTVTSIRHHIEQIIQRDYLGVLQRKMDAVYSGGGGAALGLLNVNLTTTKEAEREKRERDLRTTYSVFLNDLDLSATYMDKLVQEVVASRLAEQWFLPNEVVRVHDQVSQLSDLSVTMRNAAKRGIDQIFNQLTRPRLKTLLENVYKGVSYVLDEAGYNEAEANDVVRRRFVKGCDPLYEGFKISLTDTNFLVFFGMMIEVFVRPWERIVFDMQFTELGAIRFDRDVRAMANHLSSQTSYGSGLVREKFTRLQQMATVLNLDQDEDPEEFYTSSGIAWRLSKGEYDAVVRIKV